MSTLQMTEFAIDIKNAHLSFAPLDIDFAFDMKKEIICLIIKQSLINENNIKEYKEKD